MALGLKSLVTLKAASNKITHLTPHINHWQSMRHLQLGSVYGGNLLTTVPDEINEMHSLQELDLSHNQLQSLPGDMHVPTLEHLNVSNNQLDTLPCSVAKCAKLTTLNVSKNHLTTLPADLVQLDRLELLDISENLLCILPSDILERMKTTLLITGNPMTRPGHCYLSSGTDAYARILQRMTQQAVPRMPTRCWKNRDVCGPKGMGCESFLVPSFLQLPLPGREQDDEDAVIDRELSFHAQQLNVHGSRPSTPQSVSSTSMHSSHIRHGSSVLTRTDSTADSDSLMSSSATSSHPHTHLIHSLRELACRTLLRQKTPIHPNLLPAPIAQDLTQKHRQCSACHEAFVNEWITSVKVKSYKGHPAVVHRVRFCSTQCWLSCLDVSIEKTVLVHGPSETDL
ncbi:hypothetical protein BDF14DRAFT_1734539 [Spinellus fusiger]|nr:hypothetical protein BDF14DRAFT_1734539 [Spinellus fusiger]